MTTKLMFISSSEPLVGGRVRLPDGRELSLDDTGQLAEPLPPGTRYVEVLVQGEWKSQSIDLNTQSALMVIDVSRTTGTPGLIGSMLGGRYRIDDTLGAGGMGVVYKATDTRLGRDVAIKMLSEQFRSNDEARRLFLEEARQMAPLSHPNLVSIHDVTTIDGYDLMVTELIVGTDLSEVLEKNGPFAIDDALLVAYQLTVAVAFLHEQGLIHRDLKPANAIREADGTVKLIDFGLARSLDHLVAKGTAVRGTPAYMAPEQVLGSELSSATDIFQLGVTFYELLSDNFPVDISSGNFFANAKEEPRHLQSYRPEVPEALAELIHACLDKTPAARPTAPELAERLGELYFQRTGSPPISSSSSGAWTAPLSAKKKPAARSQPDPAQDAPPPADDTKKLVRIFLGLTVATLLVVAALIAFVVSDDPLEVVEETPQAVAQPSIDPTPEPVEELEIATDETTPDEVERQAEVERETEELGEIRGQEVGEEARAVAALPAEEPAEERQTESAPVVQSGQTRPTRNIRPEEEIEVAEEEMVEEVEEEPEPEEEEPEPEEVRPPEPVVETPPPEPVAPAQPRVAEVEEEEEEVEEEEPEPEPTPSRPPRGF